MKERLGRGCGGGEKDWEEGVGEGLSGLDEGWENGRF
jgi:hypothetical protein